MNGELATGLCLFVFTGDLPKEGKDVGSLSSCHRMRTTLYYTTQIMKFFPPFVHFVLIRTPDGLAAVRQFNLANDYQALSLLFVTGSYVYQGAVLEDWAKRRKRKATLRSIPEQRQRSRMQASQAYVLI